MLEKGHKVLDFLRQEPGPTDSAAQMARRLPAGILNAFAAPAQLQGPGLRNPLAHGTRAGVASSKLPAQPGPRSARGLQQPT